MDTKQLEVSKARHKQIKRMAADEGISMKSLSERLLRCGLVARRLYSALYGLQASMEWQPGDVSGDAASRMQDAIVDADIALAAYEAAVAPLGRDVAGKETDDG